MSHDRITVRVPSSSLSDAALMADYRARRCNRLTVEELAEIAGGTSLELTAKRSQTRWQNRRSY